MGEENSGYQALFTEYWLSQPRPHALANYVAGFVEGAARTSREQPAKMRSNGHPYLGSAHPTLRAWAHLSHHCAPQH